MINEYCLLSVQFSELHLPINIVKTSTNFSCLSALGVFAALDSQVGELSTKTKTMEMFTVVFALVSLL